MRRNERMQAIRSAGDIVQNIIVWYRVFPLDGEKKGYRWPIRFRRRGGMSIIEPVKEERWKSENKTPASVLPCNGLTAIFYWHKKTNDNFNMNM